MALLALLLIGAGSAWAETVTDELTADEFAATTTTYVEFSGVSFTSDAIYAGNSAKTSSGGIQLRSKSSSGIVSTTSGGKLKSVTITVASGSNTVDVYGKNTAYSAASDLYNASNQGTKIGSLSASGTITVEGDYEYIGIRSNNGALYLTSIEIVWETTGGSGSDPVAVTSVTLNESSLDMNVGDTETLEATVYPSNATNKSVTWTSSDPTVASVENGVVTANKKGSATITVTTTDGSYTATCAVTVTPAPLVITADETIIFEDKGFTNAADLSVVTQDDITLTFGKGEGTNDPKYYDTGKGARLYNGNTLTVASAKKNIVKIVFTFSGSSYTGSLDCGENGDYSDSDAVGTWTGEAKTVEFSNGSSSQARIQSIAVTYEYAVASIGDAGMATFSSTKALDFTGVTNIAAYIASVSGEKMTFTRIYKVPANTGLLLRNAEGESEGAAEAKIPVLDGDADATTGNALVDVADEIASLATTDGVNTYYILNKVNGNLGFYQAAGHKVAAGKAYLKVSAATARGSFAISFDDENTTGIETINNAQSTMSNEVFDLQGRRVVQPQKGLYIVNGKKVVLK